MKKLLLFIATLSTFAACTTDTTEDVAQIVVPDCLQVSIADEESRMQLSNEKTVWTAGDKVSVFYKSDANQCWKFNGKTGDRSGTLSCVSQGTATVKMEKVVIVYPYSESYMITPSSGNIEAKLPAVQKYLHGSYGLESSPMISSGYYTQFALKNVCGWLKLQLSGTGTITKITLKGNNDEQLAGDMYINAADATVTLASASVDNDDNQETGGTLVFEDSIVKEVELNCDGGVDLSGADVTPFYIALPPTVFEQGFTATLHFDNGMQKDISTSKKVEITRNHIVPMETIEVGKTAIPNNQIWYTSTDGEIVEPYTTDGFGANIISNTYEDGKGIITFDGEITTMPKMAFNNCAQLTNIAIPDSVTTIGNSAFKRCSNLSNITIPDSITTIEVQAFYWCGNLTNITIPNNVVSIGDGAFIGCSSMTSITIPNSVTLIGDGVFTGCSSLTSFYGKSASSDNRYLIIDSKLVAFAPFGLTKYTIPNSVTSIGESAFQGCSNLTSITIPNSVTSIETWAFRSCKGLTNITIPNSVTSIGRGAFDSCSSLTSINIPDKITSIESSVFSDCSNLTSVTIPDNVTSIGGYAFQRCSNLTSINIPDGVTSIGQGIFSYCSSLKSITIPDRVTAIGDFVFFNCSSLESIYCKPTTPPTLGANVFRQVSTSAKIYVPAESVDAYKSATGWSDYKSIIVGYTAIEPDNISIKYVTSNKRIIDNSAKNSSWWSKVVSNTYDTESNVGTLVIPKGSSIGYNAFYNCIGLLSIEIPDNMKGSIDSSAFYGCTALKSIIIGKNISYIGSSAFYNCNRLTNITIPSSVTSIGENAFSYCSNLASVYITDIAKWCAIKFDDNDSNPLYYAHNLYLSGKLVTDLIIPDSVTSIEDYAFYRCSSLTSINITDGVTSIGRYAFYDCSSLTSVTIPDSVISIGEIAFFGCCNLTNINIPDGIISIGRSVFRDCSSLTNVTIPNSVTSIGGSAFEGCSSLTSVNIPDGVTSIESSTFYGCSSLKSINIPDSVISIGNYAFNDCSSLTSITIGNHVTSIGDSVFNDCSNLTNITIPDSVTSIGDSAFNGCSSLTSITIPDSVISIGNYAFNDCSSLTSITIPDSVTEIGLWHAFSGCSSLTSIAIPDSVTEIGGYAFCGCSSLTSINIPDNVTEIGDSAFSGCSSLTSINIPDSVTKIGDSAFMGCSGLRGVYITNIAKWCVINFRQNYVYGYSYSNPLYYAHNLYLNGKLVTDLIIPNGVTSIGDGTFCYCSNLTSVIIPDSVTTIGSSAFYNCSDLTSITIPDSVTSIGVSAFYNCSSLTKITIGNHVTSIDEDAFSNCSNLISIYCKPITPPTIWRAFYNISTSSKIYVPTASVDAYKSASGWSNYADQIIGYDF